MALQIIPFIALCLGSYQDIKIQAISPIITYPLILLGVLFSVFNGLWLNFVVALIISIFLGADNFLGGIGGGDIKLIIGLVLFNIFDPISFCLFLGALTCFFGIAWFIIWSIWKKNKDLKKAFPLVPAIFFAWIITILILI